MHNIFEILEKAAKAFNQSDVIKNAYIANASVKESITPDRGTFKRLKERAKAKNISLIEDPFRDQLIPAFASIFQAAKKLAASDALLNKEFPNGTLPEEVLLPYNIKVLETLLGDEYQLALADTNKKEALLNKLRQWLNYLDATLNGTNSADQYYLTQLFSALSYLKEQLTNPNPDFVNDENSQLGEKLAKLAIKKLKQPDKLSSHQQLPDSFIPENFPFLNTNLVSAYFINATPTWASALKQLQDWQRQERIRTSGEKMTILEDKIKKRLTDLEISYSSMSQTISRRQRTDPELDSDLTKLAILTEIHKKLKNAVLSDNDAIQASDQLIQRRGIELLKKPAQLKYPLINWLRNIFQKKSVNQLNFFSVMNKLEKSKSTAIVDLPKDKKTRFKV